ncbi:hypothetical protein FIBSPDRAFT_453378 [Athelia psychrophila]|uniref:Uncharacterized protein n=1 Tax=Athelia psychrophila TaxID=1759441 RepID=A0A166M6I5_9AGAM|nr:hypothetical protein FIBSPDRAFT_453378 [Fibularhizoctonia sp. CBS 109695]
MASPSSRRPLPSLPTAAKADYIPGSYAAEMYRPNLYESLVHPDPYDQYPVAEPLNAYDAHPKSTLSGGTMLHQGYYDLLSVIPTPSPSRLLWGATWSRQPEVVAGPRYEGLSPLNNAGTGPPKLLPYTTTQLPPCLPKRGVSAKTWYPIRPDSCTSSFTQSSILC